jgi:hypothetical protein
VKYRPTTPPTWTARRVAAPEARSHAWPSHRRRGGGGRGDSAPDSCSLPRIASIPCLPCRPTHLRASLTRRRNGN